MALGKFSKLLKKKPDRRVKVFGERNTGTRAVVRMLRAHEGVGTTIPELQTSDELDMLENRIHEKLEGFALELFKRCPRRYPA